MTYVTLLDFPVKAIRQIQLQSSSHLPVKDETCSNLCGQGKAEGPGNASCLLWLQSSEDMNLRLLTFLSQISPQPCQVPAGWFSSGGQGYPSPREHVCRLFFNQLHFIDSAYRAGQQPELHQESGEGRELKLRMWKLVGASLKSNKKLCNNMQLPTLCLGLSAVPWVTFNIRRAYVQNHYNFVLSRQKVSFLMTILKTRVYKQRQHRVILSSTSHLISFLTAARLLEGLNC